MKVVIWAALLAVGALTAPLLGLSMLAASETEGHALASMAPWSVLMTAELRATSQTPNWGERPASHPKSWTVKPPCMPAQTVTAKGGTWATQTELVLRTDSAESASMTKQALCLHRLGFLSQDELASITGAETGQTRSALSRIVPLSLQIVPSTFLLIIWSLLIAVELVFLLLFVRHFRRDHRRGVHGPHRALH